MPSLGFEDLPNVTKSGATYESHTESHQNSGPNLLFDAKIGARSDSALPLLAKRRLHRPSIAQRRIWFGHKKGASQGGWLAPILGRDVAGLEA